MLDLGLDFSGFNEIATTAGGTATLRQGKSVPYNASVNGISIPAYVTLESAKLSRISLLKQTQITTGKQYWLVTGILKPVKMNIDLVVDGNKINLVDLLHNVAQKTAGAMSKDDFLVAARRLGFNFEEGMPLFFQQFGANIDGFESAVNAFRAAGAVNATPANAGRIVQAWAHAEGVPVTQFELGTVDRSQSPRNQGFLNLVEAQIEQFARILGLRKQANLLQTKLSDTSLSQEQIKKINSEVRQFNDLSRQWASSWSGAQQRLVNDGTGGFTTESVYDPVNAPCGRFTMVVHGANIEIDLWSNSARANTTTPVVPPTDQPF